MMFMLISALLAFGVGQHYFIAKALKSDGEAATVLVLKKVEATRSTGDRSHRFYILEFANGRRVKHYSQAHYPVGKQINILFFPSSPTVLSLSPLGIDGLPTRLSVSQGIVWGSRQDSLWQLYFSSVKNDMADYGIIHSLGAGLFGYLAIKALWPFSIKRH